MHQVSDDTLRDILPVVKKIVFALGIQDYNLLQNNGSIAHQVVKHAHFHIIPKPEAKQGLIMQWNTQKFLPEELEKIAQEIRAKIM